MMVIILSYKTLDLLVVQIGFTAWGMVLLGFLANDVIVMKMMLLLKQPLSIQLLPSRQNSTVLELALYSYFDNFYVF